MGIATGSDPAPASPEPVPAGVVRVSTFHARPGQTAGLINAAARNARDALASPGCLSADVCTHPEASQTVLVISRWASAADLQAFLDWHEERAHGVVSPHATGAPTSVHYLTNQSTAT